MIVFVKNNSIMRGNHQEESPLIKFTPEVAKSSHVYQVQKYTRQAAGSEQFELNTFSKKGVSYPTRSDLK